MTRALIVFSCWLLLAGRATAAEAPSNATPSTADATAKPAEAVSPAASNVPSGPDAWRYRWHEGHWWFYDASNRWQVWDGAQWHVYLTPPTAPAWNQPYGNGYGSGYWSYGWVPGDWGQRRTNHGWDGGWYSSGGGYGSSDFGYGYGIPIPRGY
jgi:hypothetical protein